MSGSSTITCTSDGWDSLPTCSIQECSDPKPANGSVNLPHGVKFGSIAFISCNENYVLQGDAQITCVNGPVWSSTPKCIRDCGDPSPTYGYANIATGTTEGSQAQLLCNTGYTLNGSDSVTCTETGWDGQALCNIQECDVYATSNGTVDAPKGRTVGELAILTCHEGFYRSGAALITCKAGPQWSASPTCVIKDCGYATPVNGSVNSNVTTFGATITVTCDVGHILSGSAEIICQSDGTWSDTPTCSAACGHQQMGQLNIQLEIRLEK
ncbi:sushi, von Willebrand factor type A, EGF and pentraxin domain-containing protein 1-like [Dreissena polymorpha]|uniref:sushi, von Willebrand factor type A, EGF and pentraxin domain-containing protein 1-like n=1 Tax=Dreissena polymorpha TaxID=45954 RepID=UPI002264187F|nr:sushi, von Willebrand factor type A, EGF and pentraxin domain-containing protein 1-like [Dreissena polymorpha]